ncbi:MAG: UDP-N-acetylmuramate--L-alanine ligase [Epsilonproteobacteria bacterium]|nr:UDP-N-acetylmuramate--L-alanine ligase [Campylobacterota bacterium]
MSKFHFIGIGGIGLSAMARFLKKEGHDISGSDMRESDITQELRDEGISVFVPHDFKNITNDLDYVIYSAAVKKDNVEYKRAVELGLNVLSRKEALKIILHDKEVYAVAGAHGKSTTSAILASLIDASMLIGAKSNQFGSNMRYVKGNKIVFEADESDESFLNSNPYLAIVTNCEPEHMEYYGHDLDRFYGAYEKFLKIAKIRVVNAEDEFLKSLDLKTIKLYPSKDIKNIRYIVKDAKPYTLFELKDFGEFTVFGLGDHIALDASLVILAGLALGYDADFIRERLKDYRGIKKRFDILLSDEKRAIVDDYAHHPTEIEVTLKSARNYAKLMGYKNIRVIWQPHKYSRVLDNLEKFKTCFKEANELTILPVWSAGESKVDIDFEEIFKRYKPKFADKVKREDDKIELIKNDSCIEKLESELIIGFGAGDLTYQLRGVG